MCFLAPRLVLPRGPLLRPLQSQPVRRSLTHRRATHARAAMGRFAYPAATRGDVVETLHGVPVADPYRALEDPDAEETVAFCKAQNAVAEDYFARAPNFRAKTKKNVERLMDYDKYSNMWKAGEYYYYSHHAGLANHPVMYQSREVDGANADVFLDPNGMSEDGTASIGRTAFSDDGKLCAYSVQRSGSDWADLQVINAETREPLEDTLEWAKFVSIAWTHDNKGFYYTRYPAPDSLKDSDKDKRGAETDEAVDQEIYYHVVGTKQADDRAVLKADPEFRKNMYGVSVTDDGNYLIVTVSEDCSPRNKFWYVDISQNFGKESENIVKLIDTYEAQYGCIANDGDKFYMLTNLKAPRYRVLAIIGGTEGRDDDVEVIPEHAQRVLSTAMPVNKDQLVLVYMQDASDRLYLHSLESGKYIGEVPLPDLGGVSVWGKRRHDFMTLKFSSFLYPGTVYHCDLTKPLGESTRVVREMKPQGFDASKYHTRQIWYESKDGTKVPMFVVGPRDEPEDGKAHRPVLLYGYGGFCISMTPFFSIRFISWLQAMNGVFVVANIRGGDEYGEEWHNGGIIDKKQNVFDDFQYAAKALVERDVATAKKICIMGGSNGGLLVGACINQAPELFGAAVAQVGVMDMLRFSKFTIGSAWVSDFGSPDKPDEFGYLLKYSPLHNTFAPGKRGTPYPATLLTTGSHDDRVVPLHSLKLAATLQWRVSASGEDVEVQGDAPIVLRVDIKAGHGAGKPTSKVIDELTDTLTFAAVSLGVEGLD